MNRTYQNQKTDCAGMFIGAEVERTPAFGMKTLFVVGIQDYDKIDRVLNSVNSGTDGELYIRHIFFGANHSFNPDCFDKWDAWERLIGNYLSKGYLCSLDIPVQYAEPMLESALVENNNFIPQIRVPLPYIKQWNYNTMIKIDDKGYDQSNPGVWCHRLHDLMASDKFTAWHEYTKDKLV